MTGILIGLAVSAAVAIAVLAGGLWLVWYARRIGGPDTAARDPYDLRDGEPADSGIAGEVEGWLRERSNPQLPVVPGRTSESPGRLHTPGAPQHTER